MGKKVNLNLTENEKIARNIVGLETDALHFKMGDERSFEQMVAQQKAETFNTQVNEYVEKFDKHSELLKQYTESIKDNMNSIEIKPMFSRVLVKPFEHNPFQQIKVTNTGLITDLGGMTPTYKSTDTGEWEEERQFIVTGTVIDVGPECKYLAEGDVIFYRVDTAVPVPFFKQGLVSLSENQVISVVNEGLTERFNKVK
ncbi:MAG: hypothetical protein K2G70_03465 [Turicibacter sp.]|nr:hypothetical protein [Turicibacter sp.]